LSKDVVRQAHHDNDTTLTHDYDTNLTMTTTLTPFFVILSLSKDVFRQAHHDNDTNLTMTTTPTSP
jgi:hypothetical protein